ncbi:MAG: exodeoxyribonuclease V subunit gamma, partial [Armatimonadetes bacterium]|nr:exodeoxyribonuclease V subunit gamma [Candidatus Hippobium faecium]
LNIWGFFDEKHKNAYFGSENMSDMFTWSRNAKSLRLGKIMDKGEDIDYFRNITGEWENIFPKSLMGEYSVFFTAIEKVYRYNEYFRKNEKSESEDGIFIKPEEAVQTFREFISEFLLPESGEDSVKILIDQAFDDYIHQVAMRNYIPDFMEIFEYINMVAGRANYSKGTAFTGGVCIGKLFNIRLSSFRILYICGLNQGTFPGTDDTTSLDLSSGDPDRITKTEEDKYALYKLICSAKDKVYLTYNSFDREKDADMYMSGTLGEITEYIEKNITGKPFEIINMPLFGRSLAYYRNQNSVTDVTDVFINYYDSDHRLAEIDYNKTYLTDGVPDYPEIKAFDFTNNKETGILEITASDLVKYLLNPYEFALSSMKMRKDFDFVKDYVFEPIKIESLDINRIVSDCVNELIRERGSEINSEICVSRFGREIKGLELKYYNIFRKYEEEGLIPSGRGGEAYFNIMRDIVNNYLAENEDRNVRYLSNVYIGRLRDDRRAEYSFKPWKAVYEDAERQDDREYIFGLRDTEFTGMIPLIEETEFPEGKKEYCVINLKPGSKKEKYVFETKAFMLLLSASGYFENSIIKGRYICSDNDNIKTENYRFKEENNIQAVRNSLRELFRDMQSVKNVFDFMPYKPFTQLLEKKDEFSESVFGSMFLEKIKEDYDLSSFENHHLIKYLPYNFTLGENVLNRGIRKFSLIDNLIEADKTQKGKNKQ